LTGPQSTKKPAEGAIKEEARSKLSAIEKAKQLSKEL